MASYWLVLGKYYAYMIWARKNYYASLKWRCVCKFFIIIFWSNCNVAKYFFFTVFFLTNIQEIAFNISRLFFSQGFPTCVQSLTTLRNRIYGADLSEGFQFVKYRPSDRTMYCFAENTSSHHSTASCIVDYDTMAGMCLWRGYFKDAGVVLWRGWCVTLKRVMCYFEKGGMVLWRGLYGTLNRVAWEFEECYID